ncbi:membrane protein [Chryseobacterium sp. P1-3]|uniref:DUF4142 domain-containing protein n=1 Tax=Chryseobacterium gallinarum TaxID=1324352 RepID=A0ABX6KLG7_CHRGL|nr:MULTISPECIES: DUF4142 domain-containing protein [Chryseobacterium]KFF75676.1 membrane protein [Chryseobacterium sp. P1-3]QIY89481.1 DUF4142 domain-containing protein [Chryseobacterium gallinarum]
MRNSILTVFAATMLMVGCKKNESTAGYQSTDTQTVSPAVTDKDSIKPADSAATNTATTVSLSEQDKKFADAAAKGGIMEVMMGQLAETNASNPAVKALGQMMVKDHTKANDELKQWASKAGYTLPSGLDADKQKKYDELKTKKGTEFDRKYTELMVDDHKKDIEEFKKQSADGTETSLKSFASNTLPTLEHHLKESEKAKAAVK